MKKPRNNFRPRELEGKLWINPRRNIRGTDGDRAWGNKGNISPSSGARFLELADIALGVKRPAQKKKKGTATAAAATDHSGRH